VARRGPEIVLVRHGETEWSVSGQHTGKTDIPLTDKGRRQGRLLGGRLAERSFDLVLTSPLARAIETCELAGFGNQAKRDDDLVEWDYGAYEGRKTVDIREEVPGWTVWTHGAPEGEDAADVGARVDRVIERIRAQEGDAAVFAHGHLLRVFTARFLDMPPEHGAAFGLSTCTVSVLGYERENPVMWLWNDDSHLVVPRDVTKPDGFTAIDVPQD
jgi:broad specificity phosphatase PhoE